MKNQLKVLKGMRNASIARRALVNAYRAKPNASGENIRRRAVERINRVVTNPTRRQNIKNKMLQAAHKNRLRKEYGVNKVHAQKVYNGVMNKEIKNILNFKLNTN